jgi:hypothetical protein
MMNRRSGETKTAAELALQRKYELLRKKKVIAGF